MNGSVDDDEVRDQAGRLLEAAVAGDRVSLARLLTLVERGGPSGQAVGTVAFDRGGSSYTVGITGAPGSGKSTLTNALCTELRTSVDRVAVLAVDPSSPFSGGAILGDRVRMGDQTLDRGVFIRSLATRGHLGGLSTATPAAAEVLDAAGYPLVVIETVGVGQAEVEIMRTADTCVVVLNPGWGDAVQANKAGLMEIADLFVVNKADRRGAEEAVRDVAQMLMLRPAEGWVPPVLTTVATTGQGIAELWAAVGAHREWLETSGEGAERQRRRTAQRLRALISAELASRAQAVGSDERFETLVDAVTARTLDPWSAAREALSSPG